MSIWAAIDTAVRLQLARDGKDISYTKSYGVMPAGGNADHWVAVTKDEMRQFLLDVAARLRNDTPPLAFAWRQADPDKLLGSKLPMIVATIEDLTEDIKAP